MNKTYAGSAIVLTVLAIAAMTTVILGLARLVPRDFRQSAALEASLQAESAAWAGVEQALFQLKQAREANTYFSLNGNETPAYGAYRPGLDRINCLTNRNACPGLDRQLGILENAKPVNFTTVDSLDTQYQLTVWHKREGVGNTTTNGLDDGLTSALNQYRAAPNINPVLDRDEVRRLDVEGVSNLTISWKPIWNSGCVEDGGKTKIWLVYALLDEDNEIIERGFKQATTLEGPKITPILLSSAKTLSLRLLATNSPSLTPGTGEGGGDEAKVANCFIRYNIDTSSSSTSKAVDLGFDVIESTGISGGVRRKIRVIVNRENGRLLNILDFGLACENCTGL